jgi:hypothetical protein
MFNSAQVLRNGKKPHHSFSYNEVFVPRAGIEPARPKTLVFETNASTNSAIWAFFFGSELLL